VGEGNGPINALDTALGLQLMEPIAARWTLPPAFIERAAAIEDAQGNNRLRVVNAMPVDVRINQLVLGPAGDRMNPEVFRVDAHVQTERIGFTIDDGPVMAFERIAAAIKPRADLDALVFEIEAARAVAPSPADAANASASADDPGAPIKASGTIEGLGSGNPRITMRANGDVPTSIIDAFARRKGAIYDLLGPSTTIDLRTNALSQTSGSAMANLVSDHTQASVEGEIRDGTFHAADGARVTITRISQAFSARYLESVLPFLTRFEKTQDDDPAVLIASGLTVPIGGDMTKLNGSVLMDLGTVQFKASDFFGDILDASNNRRTGSLGGRIEPFTVSIDAGVITYDRVPIPTGDYTIETRGRIDLVKQKMEVILYLPLTALSGDLKKAFKQMPGIEGLGMVPIRIKGPLKKPGIEPALDLILEEGVPEAIDRVLNDLINKGLEELFK